MIETLLIATHNPGKLKEFRHLLSGYPVRVTSAGELNLPVPIESGTTFTENALIKARAAAKASNLPSLADDSGISIASLGGKPGVDTAPWAKAGGLQTLTSPSAAFCTCVLALAFPDGREQLFEGIVHGNIVLPPRGQGGFGFDAWFQPEGETQTYAELDKTANPERATLSEGQTARDDVFASKGFALTHRTIAFHKFTAAMFQHA